MQLQAIAQELRQLATEIRALKEIPPPKRARQWSHRLDKAGELLKQAVSHGALDLDARRIVHAIPTKDVAKRHKIVYMELAENWLNPSGVKPTEYPDRDPSSTNQGHIPGKTTSVRVNVTARCDALAKSLDRFATIIDTSMI